MFRSAATKLAHNSTIPSLAGNNDLRPLQDLILAEKQVLTSFQKLSTDFVKAAEALRVWGSGEGDDLGDILGASATLLAVWSNAISGYASHGHPMRDYLKSIRTKEENLDELKRRRKVVSTKAEAAEKKLSKMGPEHKNLTVQTDSLNALRAEIRSMDSEIMSEEAALGDFKRSSARAWMGLKFGGLVELAEKGTIAGEYGKFIIAEISEEKTQPGMPRSLYYGRAKTEQLLGEAHRVMNEVVMTTVPPSTAIQGSFQAPLPHQNFAQHTHQPSFTGSFQGSTFQASPQFSLDGPQSGFQAPNMTGASQPSMGPGEWPSPNPNDMGPAGGGPVNYLPPTQGLGAGQFFDSPTIAGPGSPTHQRIPSQVSHIGLPYEQPEQHEQAQAPPRSVDDFGVNTNTGGGLIDQPGPGGGKFATFPVKNRGYTLSDTNSASVGGAESFSSSVTQAWSSSQSPPANVPETHYPGFGAPQGYPSHDGPYAPPQGPPPGAYQQDIKGSWDPNLHHEQPPVDEGGLAYLSHTEEHHDDGSKRVRFTDHDDVDELEKRGRPSNDLSRQGPPAPQQAHLEEQHQSSSVAGKPPQYETIPSLGDDTAGVELSRPAIQDNPSPTSDTRFQNQRRVPPPSMDPAEEERKLNAAAVRDVSREFAALNAAAPLSPKEPPGQGRLSLSHDSSPLASTNAPFAGGAPSPHQGVDSPTLPYPSYSAPPTTYNQGHNTHAAYSEDSAQYQQQPPSVQEPSRRGSSPTHNLQQDAPRLPPLSTLSSSPYASPYQTPPEYPRSSPITKSSTSVNSQAPSGARTISAAAFKRPQRMVSGDLAPSAGGVDPLVPKKRLPSSPYPQNRENSPSRRGRSGSPAAALPPVPAPSQALPPVPSNRGPGAEEEFDYLGAYVDSTGPSGDLGQLGPLKVANANEGGSQRGRGGSQSGYGDGRFATDLEGGLR